VRSPPVSCAPSVSWALPQLFAWGWRTGSYVRRSGRTEARATDGRRGRVRFSVPVPSVQALGNGAAICADARGECRRIPQHLLSIMAKLTTRLSPCVALQQVPRVHAADRHLVRPGRGLLRSQALAGFGGGCELRGRLEQAPGLPCMLRGKTIRTHCRRTGQTSVAVKDRHAKISLRGQGDHNNSGRYKYAHSRHWR
jgi:hypothetical protein